MWRGSLGELGAADRYAGLLVSRLPVHRGGQWNGKYLLQNSVVQCYGSHERLLERCGQREQNASPILPGVRNPAIQPSRGTTALDLRPCGHVRRSKPCEACDDDLDIECAAMGLLRPQSASSGKATSARRVACKVKAALKPWSTKVGESRNHLFRNTASSSAGFSSNARHPGRTKLWGVMKRPASHDRSWPLGVLPSSVA